MPDYVGMKRVGFYPRYVLFVLLGVYVSQQWARFLLNYLYAVSDTGYDDDKEDFYSIADATGISDTEYGLLVGYGFSLFYVLFGLVMGRAADLYNRQLIITYGLAIWNIALVFMGISQNFWQLLLSRILLGIGQSFSIPASYSLIADYFPTEMRGEANGIFAFGVYFGGALSSLSISIAQGVGWRNSCYVVAAYGLALLLLMATTIRDPARSPPAGNPWGTTRREGDSAAIGPGWGPRAPPGGTEEAEGLTVMQSLQLIFGQRLLCLLFLGGMIRFMAGYIIGAFLPSFYTEIFPDFNTAYSYINASVVAIGGATSSYLGGLAADRWEKVGEERARMYIPAIASFLGAPAIALVILVPNFYASMFCLFLEYLVAESWFGPAISVLQNNLPPRARGFSLGMYSFLTTVAGSFATYVVGVLLDTYTSDRDLKVILLLMCCGTYILSGFIFFLASRHMLGYPVELNFSSGGDETQPLLPKDFGGDATQFSPQAPAGLSGLPGPPQIHSEVEERIHKGNNISSPHLEGRNGDMDGGDGNKESTDHHPSSHMTTSH